MDYVQFGRTGVRVSQLCLGCWNFGMVADTPESKRIIARALDGGINFFDTAHRYTDGVSESIVGEALAEHRDEVVIATKCNVGSQTSLSFDEGSGRHHIMRHVERSLKRLNTDRIDLYQLHWPDKRIPIDETLRALDDLVRQGKVLYIGACNFEAWRMCEALWTSDRMGLAPFVSLQPPYNILRRQVELEGLPFCRKYDVAVIPYSPVSGGWLSGRYGAGEANVPEGGRMARRSQQIESPAGRRLLEIVSRLAPLADSLGCTLSQFATAWCLGNEAVTAPIIGPRTLDQVEDSLGALSVAIDAETHALIDRIVPPGTTETM
jgi:aryl-alcohol dehydrogenase-like predicted oxidoreductase